jgi:hypothetical protein
VSANNCTIYSNAFLDLSVEPIVLDVPPVTDRYYTINHIDFYQSVDNISNRLSGRQGGSYAFVGPDWSGPLPEGVHRVEVATNAIMIIGRTEVKGPSDLPNATAIQDQCALTSLSEWIEGNRNTMGDNQYESWSPYDVSDPLNWFVLLNEGLRRNPPYGADAALVGMFEPLGIGPNGDFDPDALDEATAAGLRRALETGGQIIAQAAETRVGVKVNGWTMIPNSIDYITEDGSFDFLYRSAIALRSQPGQDPLENFFNFAYVDENGEPLQGDRSYALTFPEGELPPSDAVWSITMYNHPDGFLIENPLNRYSLGSYDGLEANDDGSVTLHIQHENPGEGAESNWLPAPEGRFYLCLRLYNAQPEAVNLDWVPPAVARVE